MSDRAVDLVEQYLAQPSWAHSPYLRVQAREIVARVRAADAENAPDTRSQMERAADELDRLRATPVPLSEADER